MRKLFTLLALFLTLLGSGSAIARGTNNDDCTPGSTDPDCIASSKNGK